MEQQVQQPRGRVVQEPRLDSVSHGEFRETRLGAPQQEGVNRGGYDVVDGERPREWGEQAAGCSSHPGARTGALDLRGSRGSGEKQTVPGEI